MLIAIWGRDGIGKSTLADTIGGLFAKQSIAAVIDTDLTQPTLPMRLSGMKPEMDASLGKAISGIGISDAAKYLHQHPKQKQLFYAGLTDNDEYLSYEIGLEADNKAQDFIELCADMTDNIILDLSGQRTDPFVPGALINADKVLILFTPDVQGICWYNAIKPLFKSMNTKGHIIPVAAMAGRYYDLSVIEKAADIRFAAALPFVKDFRQNASESPLNGSTLSALQYVRRVKKILTLLKGGDEVEPDVSGISISKPEY